MNFNQLTDRELKDYELLLTLKLKELAEDSYYEFLKQAWDILEPDSKFISNWHIEYLADILQKEIHRIGKKELKTQDYVINIPPRSLKSRLVTVCLNAWAWIHYPYLKILTASYSQDLSLDHAVETRRLIESDWYKKNWGKIYQLCTDQNVKSHFQNNKKGMRRATSVGGIATGVGSDILICDDPLRVGDALSDLVRTKTNEWWTKTMYSRLNDQKIGLRLVVMQRLHEHDLTGYIIDKGLDYKKICVPAECTEDVSPVELKEKYKDNNFFPARFSGDFLKQTKKTIGGQEYASQMLQRPAPPDGNIIKAEWFKYYTKLPQCETYIQSWDLAFKGTATSDYVVGQVWGRCNGDAYLIDQIRGKYEFVDTVKKIIEMTEKYPEAYTKLIEDAANASASIDYLKRSTNISGLRAVRAVGSKESRLSAVSPFFEAGNIYFPQNAFFTQDLTAELITFPFGAHDDQVDALSMAVRKLLALNKTPLISII